MQRSHWLLSAALLATAPLGGCQTVSDVFNEPPADRSEEPSESAQRSEDRERTRDSREARRQTREERREQAREEARERAREDRRTDARDRAREAAREDAREEARREARRSTERSRERLARDYVADSACPMAVDGADVRIIDIVDGLALEFTAPREQETLTALRDRVRGLVDTQREVRSAADIDDPDLTALPPARVSYNVRPDGARVEFKVDNERDLGDLREGLRERIQILDDEGECPREFMTMVSGRGGRAG